MANAKTDDARAADVIKNWIRNRYTIELLGTWEIIHNPDFKVVEFDHFKSQAGLPSFVMSVSDWVEKTNAIGLVVRKGVPKAKISRAREAGMVCQTGTYKN